ncbi:MAG: hypothetical protein JJ892_04035 [Balneola sp.]|nr:hypothetical protein [Balneola sp.]MBO6652295.1 hypothetical protein [Balneola sp.]MBO6710740.1 hypothetical protein [Balneola sp.]MBO6799427.1 hypothetical protein [Balneola sp.]MBO6869445.1 hypothetical protein [Balneola sp.]
MINIDRHSLYRNLITFIGCFCLISGTSNAQNLSTIGPVDSLTVGEIFNFSITVHNSGASEKIIFPDSNSFGGNIEFISVKHFKVSASKDSAQFELQFFGIEDAVIPPLPVKIVSNADTNLVFSSPYPLNYKQIIASEEDELKPLKPNYSFPVVLWPYLVGALIVLGIAFFIWWKYFRNQKSESVDPKPVPEFKNPVKELESVLLNIKDEHTAKPEKDFKWFYSELGDALRWYIEELYKIPALESTTREVLRYMDAFGVDVQLVKHTRIVLNEADMTKFAKFKPTLDESWAAYKEGLAFLERAKIVDGTRIHRMKTEFESQFIQNEEEKYAVG